MPEIPPFEFSESACRAIGRRLGWQTLTTPQREELGAIIACYLLTAKDARKHSGEITPGRIAHTLETAFNGGPKSIHAQNALLNRRRSDDETYERIAPLLGQLARLQATAVPDPDTALKLRLAEVRSHDRITSKGEAFRHVCAVLAEFFRQHGLPVLSPQSERDGWRLCERFAQEVFAYAGIKTDDYFANPRRLREMLQSRLA